MRRKLNDSRTYWYVSPKTAQSDAATCQIDLIMLLLCQISQSHSNDKYPMMLFHQIFHVVSFIKYLMLLLYLIKYLMLQSSASATLDRSSESRLRLPALLFLYIIISLIPTGQEYCPTLLYPPEKNTFNIFDHCNRSVLKCTIFTISMFMFCL